MIDGFGNPRITDFGLAAIARSPHSPRTPDEYGCTARWCAPEILKDEQPAGKQSDVFSLGMVIIEVGGNRSAPFQAPDPSTKIFTGKAPFGEDKAAAVIAKIMSGKLPKRPNHASFTDHLWEFTQQCLGPTPSNRPNAEQILEALEKLSVVFLQSNGVHFTHRSSLGRPNQAVPTSPTPPGGSPGGEAVPGDPSTISQCILMSAVRCALPKTRTGGNRRVPPVQVDAQSSQTLRGDANGTSSRELIYLPSPYINNSIWDSQPNRCKVSIGATGKHWWCGPPYHLSIERMLTD